MRIATFVAPLCLIAVFAFGMSLQGPVEVIGFLAAIGVVWYGLHSISIVRDFIRSSVHTTSPIFLGSCALGMAILPFTQAHAPFSLYVETTACVLAVTVLALSFTLGLSGLADMSVSVFVGVGAYTAAAFSIRMHCPTILTPLLGAIIAGLIAKSVGFAILRSRGHYFTLATFGLTLIAFNVFVQAVPITGGADGIRDIPGIVRPGTVTGSLVGPGPAELFYQAAPYYWTLLCLMAVYFLVARAASGQFGRCLRAIRENEAAAAACGINVLQYRSWAYTIAGCVAGFAGALFAHTVNYIAPEDFGVEAGIYYLVLAVLGGFGQPLMCVAAAFAIVFLREKLRDVGDIRMLALSVAIIAIALYRARSHAGESPFARTE